MFFPRLAKPLSKINPDTKTRGIEHLYKFPAIFKGEKEKGIATFSSVHSMLANLILDYPKAENENELITNLRENYNKIISFSKDDTIDKLKIKNCNLMYQGPYKEMLKHILISDKNLPKNIDPFSITKIAEDLTYVISKK